MDRTNEHLGIFWTCNFGLEKTIITDKINGKQKRELTGLNLAEVVRAALWETQRYILRHLTKESVIFSHMHPIWYMCV